MPDQGTIDRFYLHKIQEIETKADESAGAVISQLNKSFITPFDREDINEAILTYLRTFAVVPTLAVAERWHGVYPKMKDGRSELIAEVAPSVWVVNGLGGAGMTLSFGLAEEVVAGFI